MTTVQRTIEAGTEADTASWQDNPDAVARFVTDLIASEVKRLRPGGAQMPHLPWPSDLYLDERGLGLDSLERLTVASTLVEALDLPDDGDALLASRKLGEWLSIVCSSLRTCGTHITFLTSGSSGTPKQCIHQLAELEQEVEHWSDIFRGTKRILSAVPCHHIYGFLFTLLLPARLGLSGVVDVRTANLPSLARRLRPGDLLISHPAHWRLLAQHQKSFPDNVLGVTSTAPCPEALASELQRAGLRRLVQVYGSSETGGIGWRDSPDAPFTLLPFWSRHASSSTTLSRRSPQGVQELHQLQDAIEWDGARNLRILGRLDAAVQVCGTNVFPGHVKRVLMEHPQVADASVRLMSAEEGNRLKAFIVPALDANVEMLAESLMRWANSRLAPAERPKVFRLGATVPVNESGKACDWSIHP